MRLLKSFLSALLASAVVVDAITFLPPELFAVGQPPKQLSVTFQNFICNSSVQVQSGSMLQSFRKSLLRTNLAIPSTPQLHVPLLTRISETSNAPIIANTCTLPQNFIIMMLDPDINTTHPLYPGLHYMASNINTSRNVIASYIGPAPAAGMPPHNYTILAFALPNSNFSVPAAYAPFVATTAQSPKNRVNFPLAQFVADTGLGQPFASNWFREENDGAANATACGGSGGGAGSGFATPTMSSGISTQTASSGAKVYGNRVLACVLGVSAMAFVFA